ncbi:hypothetical protein EDD22DRAFT_884560 [Suillus occidentalis]|nr:hypothetical protein EDD22DRAFT_884560 [Suillus occidentalis]
MTTTTTTMSYKTTQIISVLLYLSSSAYAQGYSPYTNWNGRIAGIVIGILILLLFLASCLFIARRRRRNRPFIISKPDANYQGGAPYSLPVWPGGQMYGPPPGPPPSHPYHTGNMSPYEFSNKDPGSQPTPPPYVKNGEGVSMPQGTDYSSPPGPPPAAYTRGNNRFV